MCCYSATSSRGCPCEKHAAKVAAQAAKKDPEREAEVLGEVHSEVVSNESKLDMNLLKMYEDRLKEVQARVAEVVKKTAQDQEV